MQFCSIEPVLSVCSAASDFSLQLSASYQRRCLHLSFSSTSSITILTSTRALLKPEINLTAWLYSPFSMMYVRHTLLFLFSPSPLHQDANALSDEWASVLLREVFVVEKILFLWKCPLKRTLCCFFPSLPSSKVPLTAWILCVSVKNNTVGLTLVCLTPPGWTF